MNFYRIFLLYLVVLLIGDQAYAQNTIPKQNESRIYGYVTHQITRETLYGVNVVIPSIRKGTSTDENGYYEMIVPKGMYRITASRIDLKQVSRVVDLEESQQVDLVMSDGLLNLEEVSIYGEREDANVRSLDIGKSSIEMERITDIPSFLGEADIVKAILLLPGITSVGEGASGFNVRGGGVDQNLILQDGGLIFNPSHVFGFFSSFNPQLVKKVTLYKGGIPARYGGRLSSVMEVDLKDGHFQNYHVDVGLGLVSTKLVVDGPVLKDKLSFALGGRISYSDWLFNSVKRSELKNSTASFQDFNLKFAYLFSKVSKISYSGYLAHDDFAFSSDTTYEWATHNHVLSWKYFFDENFSMQIDLTEGKYSYNVQDQEGFDAFSVGSSINYRTVRADFGATYFTHDLNFGAEILQYRFSPGLQRPMSDLSGVERREIEPETSYESAIYFEDDYKINSWFSVRAGLRFSSFLNVGAGTDYLYSSDQPMKNTTITDTVSYGKGEVIAYYAGLSPRISFNARLSETRSIKGSYNRAQQYLHLITNTSAVTPTDVWKTSNRYIEPERGNQFSLGFFQNFQNNQYETSVETYYKTVDNLVDFKDGTVLLMNENIEADLVQGTGKAYGVEFLLKKKSGDLTGWAGYTYSRSLRRVSGHFEEERISNGKTFPSNYDKPHDLTLTLDYRSGLVTKIGANFTYSSGRPQTVPLSIYNVSNLTNIFNFSERNGGRIPDYHRLDLSMTFFSYPKRLSRFDYSLTFSVYNVYARKNAYSVFYQNQFGSPPKAYKLSVLGSVFPSITFVMKWNSKEPEYPF